jgi:peptidoglycan/LPS O-acetylase OafA/YrhL
MTAFGRSGMPAGVQAEGGDRDAGSEGSGPTSARGTSTRGGQTQKTSPLPAGGRRVRLSGLDGVRALAVLAVMAFHEGLPWMPGGFLGVDVFFVLSGYLITDLLVAQFDRRGRLDLRGFWARRARRLLPALAVVLVTVTAAVTVFEPDQLSSLRRALLAAVTFSSNWSQAVAHQSYFSVFGPPPPLQHLWSLAVEEQFYLVWPLVLAVAVIRLRRRWLRATIAWAGAAASAATMAAVYVPGSDPSFVYYGTDTHASGLLIGAALALTWPLARVAAASARAARALDVAGLLGLAAIAWAITHFAGSDAALYPAGLVFAALAAGAVVIAAAAPGWIGRMLGCRPLRWLGVRSYGIYLWHWPVIALFPAVAGYGVNVAEVRLAETVLPILLAAASWRWIEEPILRNSFGTTLRQRRRQIIGALTAAGQSPRRALPLAAPVALVTVACVAGYGLLNPPGGLTLQQQIAEGEKVSAATQIAAAVAHTGRTAQRTHHPAARGHETDLAHLAAQPAVTGSMVTAVGDSVMLASAQALETVLPGIYINAVVSRQMSAGVHVVRELAASGQLRPILLLGLGTNGNMSASEISEVRAAIGPDRWLVLINTYEPRPWEEPVNAMIDAAAQDDPHVLLVNWYGAIGNHTNMLREDDVHPLPPGAVLYAQLIKSVVERAR